MKKVMHDKRSFYDRRTEKVCDPEWEKAKDANEQPKYYWCYTDIFKGIIKHNSARFVHLYKPSMAKLIQKRTGWILEEVCKK